MKLHTGSKVAGKFKLGSVIDQTHITKHFIIMMFIKIALKECMSILPRDLLNLIGIRCLNVLPVRYTVCERTEHKF